MTAPHVLRLLFASLLLTLVAALLVSPWRLEIGNDVPLYTWAIRTASVDGAKEAFVAPFFAHQDNADIPTQRTKPVFVVLMNAWFSLVGKGADDAGLRTRYLGFVLVCHFAMVLTLALLAYRADQPYAGLWAAALLTLNPWMLVLVHWPTYTQLSAVFLLLSAFFSSKETRIALLVSGTLSACALMTNSASIVYAFGIGLHLLFARRRAPKAALLAAMAFVAGLTAPYLVPEALLAAGFGGKTIGERGAYGPASILVRYYQRHYERNHFMLRKQPVPPRRPGLLLLFLWATSPGFALLLAAALAVRMAAGDPETSTGPPLAAALVGIAAIELAAGVQLGRAYLLGMPLLLAGVVPGALRTLAGRPGLRRPALALAVLLALDLGLRLGTERVAYLGLHELATRGLFQGRRTFLMKEDLHRVLLSHLLEPDLGGPLPVLERLEDAAAAGVPDGLHLVLVGPRIESVLDQSSPVPIRPGEHEAPRVPLAPGRVVQVGSRTVTVGAPALVPFYGLYPLTTFEDEIDLWRWLYGHFGDDDYRRGPGAVQVFGVRVATGP